MTKSDMIKVSVKKLKGNGRNYYRGMIKSLDNGNLVWDEVSMITRLTEKNALADARNMADEYGV